MNNNYFHVGFGPFQHWVNPLLCSSGFDIDRAIKSQINFDENLNDVNWNTQDNVTTKKSLKGRWFKFWFAVHELYEYANQNNDVDEVEITKLSRYNAHFQVWIKYFYTPDGPYEHYRQANLLGEENEGHRTLFFKFSDGLMPPGKRQETKDFLLEERKKVVELFDKVAFLKERHVVNRLDAYRIVPYQPNPQKHELDFILGPDAGQDVPDAGQDVEESEVEGSEVESSSDAHDSNEELEDSSSKKSQDESVDEEDVQLNFEETDQSRMSTMDLARMTVPMLLKSLLMQVQQLGISRGK
jgi:hypothetical protein